MKSHRLEQVFTRKIKVFFGFRGPHQPAKNHYYYQYCIDEISSRESQISSHSRQHVRTPATGVSHLNHLGENQEASNMGGIGSGQWARPRKRATVQDCNSLDVNQLARDGVLRVGALTSCCWQDHHGNQTLLLDFSTVAGDHSSPILLLSYRWEDWRGGASEAISIPVTLQTPFPNFGGKRWYFTCPLVIDGVPCNRRMGKLYLPPGARHFGCRICHDLTYQSCRVSHLLEQSMQRVSEIRRELDRLLAAHGR